MLEAAEIAGIWDSPLLFKSASIVYPFDNTGVLMLFEYLKRLSYFKKDIGGLDPW